ncbi:MAG: hypothetical protein IT186_00895 [Acidobacteria bacterium]|nr:hypothetical protein [Acidobacteriota bacterium]
MQTSVKMWLLLVLALCTSAGLQCLGTEPGGRFLVDKTPDSYRIRVDESHRLGPVAPQNASIESLAAEVSQNAGATLFLWGTMTMNPVSGEWAAPTPREALTAFAGTAGLRLVVSDDKWVLVPKPEYVNHFRLQVFSRCLDGADRAAPRDVEEAILKATGPHVVGFDEAVWLGLSYTALSDEGPGIFLAIISVASGAPDPRMIDRTAYKVRLRQEGTAYKAERIWSTSVSGPLCTIALDFDRDGFRDFVFDTGSPDSAPDMLVGGRDGAKLAEFLTGKLLVEANTTRIPRFVADMAWEELLGARVFEYRAETRMWCARDLDERQVGIVYAERRKLPPPSSDRPDQDNRAVSRDVPAEKLAVEAFSGAENFKRFDLKGPREVLRLTGREASTPSSGARVLFSYNWDAVRKP